MMLLLPSTRKHLIYENDDKNDYDDENDDNDDDDKNDDNR